MAPEPVKSVAHSSKPSSRRKLLVEKPQLKPKAKAKSNAKAWAEVANIITKCAMPMLSCAVPCPLGFSVLFDRNQLFKLKSA